ncbi:LysR substrate-binding domain-containing protein [Pantoea sp. Tr-811]|uniref:LysR substrate-binding domain-containing protein n=1 Tax=Pantoea sp. Tr-811 TaxID=2608361 RepID=UPI001963A78C|nr:LysR substrate-binding domain-containing protein [Pantoea sp. Tr-811]
MKTSNNRIFFAGDVVLVSPIDHLHQVRSFMLFPSMTALRALDAVARLGSISGAADELSLTRSAVSHRISTLEEQLGFALTERIGRGIRLTFRGEQFAREVQHILQRVQLAAAGQHEQQIAGRLCVSCNTGFASAWLCQHINEFMTLYPQVQFHLISPRTPADTTSNEADVFISYGTGDWPNMQVMPLMDLHYFPVLSPQLLYANGGLRHIDDLLKYTLLHMNDYTDWRVWLGAAGRNQVNSSSGVLFSDAPCALAACLAGQGVAMGDNLLSSDALRRGLLVSPFEISTRSNRAYFLVCHPAKAEHPIVKAFSDWLIETLAHTT